MTNISLETANAIIAATIKKGQDLNLAPLAVVVLDSGGHVKAFERMDGASVGRFGIAMGKANVAIQLGVPSSAMMARAEQQAYFVDALVGVFDGNFVPVPGGVLVKNEAGETLGAVGVTGDTSDNDAAAAVAGIQAVGLIAEA